MYRSQIVNVRNHFSTRDCMSFVKLTRKWLILCAWKCTINSIQRLCIFPAPLYLRTLWCYSIQMLLLLLSLSYSTCPLPQPLLHKDRPEQLTGLLQASKRQWLRWWEVIKAAVERVTNWNTVCTFVTCSIKMAISKMFPRSINTVDIWP